VSATFQTAAFEHALQVALATVDATGAGALRSAAARIVDGDADSWLREWTAAGGEAWAAARSAPTAARHLQAAACYAAAAALVEATDGSVDADRLRARRDACWEAAARLLGGAPIERGAWLFGAAGAAPAPPRPLVIVATGNLPPACGLRRAGAAAAAAALPWALVGDDGERSLAPLLADRGDRDDGEPVGVVGLADAAYGVQRALADERVARQVAAAAVDPALSSLEALPAAARAALLDGDAEGFARELRLAELFAPPARRRAAPDLLADYDRLRALIAVPATLATPLRSGDASWLPRWIRVRRDGDAMAVDRA